MRPGRFDRQVTVDAPDIKGRLSILEVHCRNKKLEEELSLESIARRTPGFTGADLANLMNEAAILTARRRKESIGLSEIDDAVDRIIAGMEGRPLTDGRSKRLIAYHEVGHALIGTLVKDHDPVQKVTLIPRGQAQGLTCSPLDEEQTLVTRAQLKARIMGASVDGQLRTWFSDIRGNHRCWWRHPASGVHGSSDGHALGNERAWSGSLEGGSQEVFLGRDLMSRSDISESISQQIDEQVRRMVKRCYEETVSLVAANREAMDRLVEMLIEKETMDGAEFAAVVAEFTPVPDKDRTVVTLD